jgi:hypothetical protein
MTSKEYIEAMKEEGIELELVEEEESMYGNVFMTKNTNGDHFVMLEQYGDHFFKMFDDYNPAWKFFCEVIAELDKDTISLFL